MSVLRKQRSPSTRFDDIPGSLPEAVVPGDADLGLIADSTISKLQTLAESCLAPEAIWRDYLAITGYLRTISSARSIAQAYHELRGVRKPSDFELVPGSAKIVRLGPSTSWIDIEFTFQTHGELTGRAAGYVSVIPSQHDPSDYQIWMLRTWLENFDGLGHPDVLEPANGKGAPANGINGFGNGHTDGLGADYAAVVIGAGQAGLAVAGRLKALSVPYLLVEKHDQIGENWTKRYSSLRFHTSKEYGNLPFDYRTFLADDNYMLTTKEIGSGYDRWAKYYGINACLSTAVTDASWDSEQSRWIVSMSSAGGHKTVTAKNLVLAVGSYASKPVSPQWPGREKYRGSAMHGVEYMSSEPWRGKRGIAVGTANTGHDVVEDMLNADFSSVTMVQRGPTFVFPAEWLHAAQDASYNLNMPIAVGDRSSFTYPNKIMREIINLSVHRLIDESPERFDALERAGFKLERKGDTYDNLYRRYGGHYVDIGTSARIAKGEVKMKGDSAVTEWTEDGLRFEDGSEVKADLIVLCTGFEHDFRKIAASIIGQEAADAMDNTFGVDAEGEVRGAYKLAGHPGLYYHGGDVRQARWFSRFIALQIQADILGKPLQPYLKTPK